MKHELKIEPQYFDAVQNGSKRFEIRKDDRGFAVGDILSLREYNVENQTYSGRRIQVRVTYLMSAALDGKNLVPAGYVVMSIEIDLPKPCKYCTERFDLGSTLFRHIRDQHPAELDAMLDKYFPELTEDE
jgi:hypothetical protein